MKRLLLFLFCCLTVQFTALAQSNERVPKKKQVPGVIRGRILMDDSREPVAGANITTSDGRYAVSKADGTFEIPAAIGDEIIVRQAGMETVFYRVLTRNELEIRVLEEEEDPLRKYESYSLKLLKDSARILREKLPYKSLDLLTAALVKTPEDSPEAAELYADVGTIYLNLGQPDLAATNLQRAIELKPSPDYTFQLASAYRANGNYQEALQELRKLEGQQQSSLSLQAKIAELQGDIYLLTADVPNAIEKFEKSIRLTSNDSKRSDRYQKLGQAYERGGSSDMAEKSFLQSTRITSIAPATRKSNLAAAADFYNRNQNYDQEIVLRKQVVDDAVEEQPEEDKQASRPETEEMVITPEADLAEEPVATTRPQAVSDQRLKMGQAYSALNKTDEALNEFLASYEDAGQNGDLDTQLAAAAELRELYSKKGNDQAAERFALSYTAILEELLAQKENQILLSERRTQELLAKQNRINSLEKDRSLQTSRLDLARTRAQLAEESNLRQKWTIIILGIFLLLLGVLSFVLWRNSRQQAYSNRLLELKSLRSQMNPHFIFNALNSVNHYIAQSDERSANRYLTRFSQLMRSILDNSELDLIPLEKELELIQVYLELEHERFKDKFDYEVDLKNNLAISQWEVPPMIVQPILENAVWHGLRYKTERGRLKLTVRQAEGKLNFIVEDDGVGRKASASLKTKNQNKSTSTGIRNIKNRIALVNKLKDVNIRLDIQDRFPEQSETGTVATLTLTKGL